MKPSFCKPFMLLMVIVALAFSSCNSVFMDEQKANTAQNNFDLLWQIIDERYCFFEEKGIDWKELYWGYNRDLQRYCDEDPSSQCLFGTMNQMLDKLRDGHVYLSDGVISSSYTGWCDPYPVNFSEGLITQYLQHRQTKRLDNGLCIAPLSESVGYIYCPSFSDKVNRDALDNALAAFADCKGIIIDVRSNGGGLVSEAYNLASRFVSERTHVGYTRYKTGKGHNDFSDYFKHCIEPEGTCFRGKVAVITNRRVYSAANLFVSVMKSLPQVRIMGDRTGGGGGVPISAELYNGWSVEFSTNPIFDTSKKSIESGIEPHQTIMLDAKNNEDNIIEAAKKWILKN